MNRIRILALCSLIILSLTGCNSAKLDQLSDQVIQLEQDNAKLKRSVNELEQQIAQRDQLIAEQKKNIEDLANTYDISIEEIKIISSEMYNEGEAQGRIYGKFDVWVKLKNNTNADISNIKVAARQETSISHYPKSLKTAATKLELIDLLKAGAEKEILFTGFRTDHPEMLQELIVNVMEHGEISKIRIKGAFAPGSND